MRLCKEHEFITYVEQDNQFYNYPLNIADISKMPDKKKLIKNSKIK